MQSALNDDTKDYDTFETKFSSTLNLNAPLKKKFIRANHAPYMTKMLKKAMIKIHELATKYYKTKKCIDLHKFKKQKNFVSKLYKKERKIVLQ